LIVRFQISNEFFLFSVHFIEVRDKCAESSELSTAITFALNYENIQSKKNSALDKLNADICAMEAFKSGFDGKRKANSNFNRNTKSKKMECFRCGSWQHVASSIQNASPETRNAKSVTRLNIFRKSVGDFRLKLKMR
jgi:hypothetical protein